MAKTSPTVQARPQRGQAQYGDHDPFILINQSTQAQASGTGFDPFPAGENSSRWRWAFA